MNKELTQSNTANMNAAELLHYQMKRNRKLREQRETVPRLDLEWYQLSQWQSDRLARTHADLLKSPRYGLATEFFLSDLYAPKDFSRRDSDLERSYPMIITILPGQAIYAVALAVELNVLSHEMDEKMLSILCKELGVKEHITETLYAEAYRRCDNYKQRQRQIQLIRVLGEDLDGVVAKPFIYSALRLARTPAQLSGFGELQDFLERGFRAFRHMKGAKEFLETIYSRETRILDRIYAHHPDPFNLRIAD